MESQIKLNSLDSDSQVCPKCGSTIPVHKGFTTWCDCGWNLYPHRANNKKTLIESSYEKVEKKIGDLNLKQILKEDRLQPKMTISKFFAYLIAGIVHCMMILWTVAGIWLLVKEWPHIPMILLSVFILTVGWLLRPRNAKMPKDIVSKREFPVLYEICDSICDKLGTSRVAGIVITDDFNASYTEVGWRRKKIIRLGLPLLWILNKQEKISVFAHEIAHGVNGDVNRGIFIGTALNALGTWCSIIRPERIFNSRQAQDRIITWLATILMIPINFLLLGVSNFINYIAYILIYLFWQDSQRAEYLADYLAAQMSGTEAALSFMEKLHLGDLFYLSVQKASLKNGSRDFFAQFEAEIQNMPERERERIERVELLVGSRLDATHPPTVFRMESLKHHFVAHPGLLLMDSQFELLNQELAVLREKINSELLRKHKESLYF